ncbi:hypothetical protein MMC30_003776 [Trapelia coarctata]|nr:hypothetical protein [Trapelia coarctata]
MLKKPSILLSSYSSIHSYNAHPTSYPPSPSSSQPPLPTPCRINPHHHPQRRLQKRGFADVRPDIRPDIQPEPPDLSWPSHPRSQLPTPYQIFRLRKGAPYNKQRFYELVKIYHPDKHHCGSSSSSAIASSSPSSSTNSSTTSPPSPSSSHHLRGRNPPTHPDPPTRSSTTADLLTPATKLERYRLIIAANAILSDPTARHAYDTYNLGWDSPTSSSIPSWRPHPHSPYTQPSYSHWSGFSDNGSPFRNATWEDWEKWYQRDDSRPKPRPRFFSNGGFVAVIILCSVLGGMGEISRARQFSGSFLEQLEEAHDRSFKDLEQRRRESQSIGDRQARVQRFLQTREPRRGMPEPEGG